MDLESIYLRLPTPLQHAVCSAVGWRTNRTRYADPFDRLLTDLEGRTYWSEDAIREYRDGRISAVVAHAAKTVPHYRRLLRERDVDPASIVRLEDLRSLPILTKDEAQARLPSLLSEEQAANVSIAHTSGTTGGALRFPVPRRATQEQWAVWWRFRGWHGIRRGTWSGLLAGRSVVPVSSTRPPFWRVNYPGRQIIFSGYHVSEATLPHYVGELRRRRPPWLHGYPSLLALLAAHLVETGTDLGYAIRWVTTGAENLLAHQAEVIERAFGVRPVQHYGMAEGVANISECEQRQLHVDEDYAAVELVPHGADGAHRIVGTGFANLATALIRYDTADLATLDGAASCGCGRPGRVVARIDGRREDYVVLANGVRVGRMDHVFKDMVNVREAQIHQAVPGEITFRVVRREGYAPEDEQALLREARKRVGHEMRIEIDYVDEVPRSPTGKLRFVVSDLPSGQIASRTP